MSRDSDPHHSAYKWNLLFGGATDDPGKKCLIMCTRRFSLRSLRGNNSLVGMAGFPRFICDYRPCQILPALPSRQTLTRLLFPSSRGGVAATTKKKPRSEAGADGAVRIISDHPGRAFLTVDGASTPPLEEGNRCVDTARPNPIAAMHLVNRHRFLRCHCWGRSANGDGGATQWPR